MDDSVSFIDRFIVFNPVLPAVRHEVITLDNTTVMHEHKF